MGDTCEIVEKYLNLNRIWMQLVTNDERPSKLWLVYTKYVHIFGETYFSFTHFNEIPLEIIACVRLQRKLKYGA